MATLRTNSKEFIRRMDEYLTTALADVDATEPQTTAQVAAYSKDYFERVSNHAYNLRQYPNTQERLANWLQGLPFHLPFSWEDIIDLAVRLGTLEPDAPEKKQDRVVDNYYRFMSYHILKFWERHLNETA